VNSSPTWLTYATTTIALLGFLLACGSLTFQVLAHKRTGRRLVINALIGGWQGESPTVLIHANSTGRLPVHVDGVSLDFLSSGERPDKKLNNLVRTFHPKPADVNGDPSLPGEVPAGASAWWTFDVPRQEFDRLPPNYELSAHVKLGDGTSLMTHISGRKFRSDSRPVRRPPVQS
jgi:hypothetical protein